MVCPKCRNKGFKPTQDIKRPLKVLVKYSYENFNERQIACLQCGYSWYTSEGYSRPVEIKRNEQGDLFERKNNGGK